jgi:O-antigen ligase
MSEEPSGRRGGARAAMALAGAAALVPPLGIVDPLAIAPLFTLAAVAVLAFDRGVATRARALLPLAAMGAALAAWAMLSAAWSIIPLHSFLEGLRLLLIVAGGVVLLASAGALEPRERRMVALAAAAGLGVALVLAFVAALRGAAVTQTLLGHALSPSSFDRGSTTLALALWPVVAARRSRVVAALLALASAAAIYLLASTAALVAIAASLVAFAAAWAAPRATAAALALGLVIFAAAAPIVVPPYAVTVALHERDPGIKWSGIHRLLIWRFTADRIAERPFLGWGMDASRDLPGGKTHFAALFPQANLPGDAEALPLHPHDAALQWEVELGAPGTLLCLALVLWGLWRLASAAGMTRLGRGAALGWAAGALVVALVAYGIWQAWWLSTLFLTAASLRAAETPRDNGDSPARDRL